MGKRPLVWDQESGSNPVVSVKVAPLLTGVWSCGVKSQFTEVVRVHLGRIFMIMWLWIVIECVVLGLAQNIDVIVINVNCDCIEICDTDITIVYI